jgi:CRISPR/Cas system-associated exonuclease Cas4 (RecB family)
VKITENPELKAMLLEKMKKQETLPTQFHVTELVHCPRPAYFKRVGLKEAKNEKGILAAELGTSLHKSLPLPIKEVVVEKDGITGHIDAVWDRIIEFKTTSRSVSIEKLLTEFGYDQQIKAYCVMAGKKEADVIIFRVLEKKLECYTIQFTDEELQNTWEMIKANKEYVEECLREGKVPEPNITGYCTICGYNWYCFPTKEVVE